MAKSYDDWLTFVFDRLPTSNSVFNEDKPPFGATSLELVEFIQLTCSRCAVDLAGFSDQQIDEGLYSIFSGWDDDSALALKDSSVPLARRLEAIRSIQTLYTDCFAERCSQTLSHLSEPASSALNHVCYMLWDITPLSYWKDHPDKAVVYPVVLELLQSALAVPHVACIEGALHGLGHMALYFPVEVEAIVSARIANSGADWPQALLDYAEAARVGCVQ
jgi:hypothetical protein